MKKTYITPTMEKETLQTSMIIAASPSEGPAIGGDSEGGPGLSKEDEKWGW